MKVTLITYTNNTEKVISSAAKLCYSQSSIDGIMDGLTDEKVADFVKMLSDMGHESPIEHASFTFGIEGVSRSLMAQITRHRIASFSVQSQRYVPEGCFQYVMPPSIKADEKTELIFNQSMKLIHDTYSELVDILKERHYKNMVELGIDEKDAKYKAEKQSIEDARYVLPNACQTKMIVTINARSLKNFFSLRCCDRAQWEIRQVANEMLRLVKQVAPTLFENAGPPCVRGSCTEGKMSCGKAAQMREYYKGNVL